MEILNEINLSISIKLEPSFCCGAFLLVEIHSWGIQCFVQYFYILRYIILLLKHTNKITLKTNLLKTLLLFQNLYIIHILSIYFQLEIHYPCNMLEDLFGKSQSTFFNTSVIYSL